MAVVFYERLYKQKGIRRQAHLFNPRVLDATEFQFPVSSVLYWWKGNETNSFITKSIPYLQRVDRGVVNSVFGYLNESEIYGKVVNRSMNPNKWIKECQDACKEFKFLKVGQQFRITPKILKIMNLGCVSAKYKYPMQVMRRYHIYRNIFTTTLKSLFIENNDRYVFLNIDLPKELPTRILLNKFSSKLLNGHLDMLPTFEHFNVLEFWKFLSPDLKHDSLIYQHVPKDKWNKVNILFTIDKKCVLIRLSVIAALIKEYNIIEPGFKDKDVDMAKKIFYRFLTSILETAAMTEAELEKHEQSLEKQEEETVTQGAVKQDIETNKNTDPNEASLEDDEEEEDESILQEVEAVEETEEEELDDSEEEELNLEEDLDDTESENIDDMLVGKDNDSINIEFNSLDELLTQTSEYDNVFRQLENMLRTRAITKKDYETNYRILSQQPNRKDPYGSKRSLIEMLDNKQDNVELKQEDLSITDNPVVFDKSSNKNVIGNVTKKYIEEQYEKDIVRTVYAMQNNNTIIEDYQVFKSETILGGTEEHVIQTRSLTGKASTVKIVLPKIEKDGTFKISNQTYTMRSQRADVVLRKIGPTRAALTSYYGKLFIEKASYKRQDTGYYLFNIISKMYADGQVTDLIALPIQTQDTELPIDYTHMNRYLKSFRYKDYLFNLDYIKRSEIVNGSNIMEYEKGGKYILIGLKGKNPLVMEKDTNILYTVDTGGKKYTEEGTIYSIMNIDRLREPVEYCDMKVYSQRIPVVAILSYYVGLEQLLKLLKVKYIKTDSNKRVLPEEGWYIVKFKDVTLKIKRDYKLHDMIFGGLSVMNKATKDIQYKVVNDRGSFQVLWNKLGYHLTHTSEIKLMENMFVDPITLSLLERLKLPTNLKGLIIKACEILVDDNYKNPNDLSQMLIKGYERVSGMMYNELIKGMREQENKSLFSKTKMVVNPYGVIQAMNEDSATTLVDDLNPMASLKQLEDVTYLGSLGRNKISMNQSSREYNESEIGTISEASKDSSDVGITAYLTANPSIDNIRGKTNPVNEKEEGWASMLSTSAMLAPFGVNDDSKRLKLGPLYSNI